MAKCLIIVNKKEELHYFPFHLCITKMLWVCFLHPTFVLCCVRAVWHEIKSKADTSCMHFFIGLLELYVDTDITVINSLHPQSVFSAEPSHGAHKSWGRARVWLTGQSKHRYAAWGEETCHRFPNEESKAMWLKVTVKGSRTTADSGGL